MKDIPNAFWAAIFISIGSGLVAALIFAPGPENFKLAVLGFCSSIITGAYGYIQGHKDGSNSVQVPLAPSSTASTTVTVDPTKPNQ